MPSNRLAEASFAHQRRGHALRRVLPRPVRRALRFSYFLALDGLTRSFDVVTLMDVIEHIPDPGDLVREVYRVLQPGGVVYIVTPNFGSLFVWLYRDKAYGIWPDQHVVYFRPSTIKRVLCRVGFQKILTGTKDFYLENLRRLFRKDAALGAAEIKAAFGGNSWLGKVRCLVNPLLFHVPLGDKLIAFAQK